MSGARCGECGKWTKFTDLYPVWQSAPLPSIEHEACGTCRPELAEAVK